MPGRNYSASSEYRYGFNGKENDKDIIGDGNSYDFIGRIYDPRVSRWLSVDPKANKFPYETPYGYVSGNPIIFQDPDGEEKIIVIGGGDNSGKDKNKFFNAGLLQLKNYTASVKAAGNGETVTVLVTMKFVSAQQMKQMRKAVKAIEKETGVKVNINGLHGGHQLTQYINSKDANRGNLSKARQGDQITDISIFGHGYHPTKATGGENDKSRFILPSGIYKGGTGAFEPAHGEPGESMDAAPLTRPEHNKWAWGAAEAVRMNPGAFAANSNFDFYTCNPSTPNAAGLSLTQVVSEVLPTTTVTGMYGRSDYVGIYIGESWLCRQLTDGVRPAQQLPAPGNKSCFSAGECTQGSTNTSERVTYKKGVKQ